MKRLYRSIPLVLIITALLLFLFFGGYRYISLEALQRHHLALQQWTSQNQILAAVIFIIIYIVAVAVSIPGATILTITGGFLFGIVFGTIYVVFAATIGASLLFLAARTALGNWLIQKAGARVYRLEKGFQDNAFNYLLFLRLVPLFPFWLVNIVPAIFNMRLLPYMLATFFGIIPGTVVYILVGNGVGVLLAAGKKPELNIIFNPEIFIPIIALALLSLVPILYKKWRKKSYE